MIAVILPVYTIIFHIIVKFSLKTNRPDKIRHVAVKYCYDSPESFTKAFYRFHGVTPSMVQKEHAMIRNMPKKQPPV